MYTVNILTQLVENNLILAYLLVFLITIVEGEIVSISAGILVLLGAFNFWIALSLIFLGGMVKTFFGYFFGQSIHKRFNNHKFFQYIEKRVLGIMPHFKQKPFWSIFISKFMMVNHLVILFAGYHNINFRKYLKAEISSTIFWAPGLMLLGYFFSYTAIRVSNEIWNFSVIIIGFIVLFILFDKLVSWLYELFEEFYAESR
ncbi:TPA: hypothetical protein DEQ22_00150 [Candidatus Nomurabacteria bacterium]|uniref:VTT domain-containing protein n=2 Tax=Candidatus Nomuraibacteriota TaxID=1752729 RepID=A0A1F6YM63_9BACT|nr:MAG: hypothetical protein UV13_C0001G0126 [Parcubacteria group bacterium GW2011_GWC1_42_21]KKS57959.1 MAG: hypothetical protein UV23_C0019G0026 [Candidatus Nomurabacteria bacterium GW2011_GWF1_42_40]KKT00655.1 MAG: hypothetical protein UV77_C0001G0026 [Candidatus Nomurabacteria bacterium GW2011_GWA1_43_17]KKT07634.1 MAG: hypothetical protein UV85_C0008G0005 [Candidatus Nomurabacteria bacterium GW2011_GWB1_43_19]KKT11814.1 MAG: hypothetical protein UV91_C0001G0026 [Candidatus Nomurabacteria b